MVACSVGVPAALMGPNAVETGELDFWLSEDCNIQFGLSSCGAVSVKYRLAFIENIARVATFKEVTEEQGRVAQSSSLFLQYLGKLFPLRQMALQLSTTIIEFVGFASRFLGAHESLQR